jgi:hypothetical protein
MENGDPRIEESGAIGRQEYRFVLPGRGGGLFRVAVKGTKCNPRPNKRDHGKGDRQTQLYRSSPIFELA